MLLLLPVLSAPSTVPGQPHGAVQGECCEHLSLGPVCHLPLSRQGMLPRASRLLQAREALALWFKVKKQERAGKVSQIGWGGGLLQETPGFPEKRQRLSPPSSLG